MKKISQRLLAAAVVVAAGASASAEVLSPEEALSRALPQARRAAPALVQSKLAYTAEAEELPAVYVFAKENKGFLLVSADDVVAPVLGYADAGNFDADNMAPAFKYWLGEYARQIAYARENAAAAAPARVSRSGRNEIAPLVKTTWNQDAPYNDLCPKYQGRGLPTGCVATAAAQIMKYHELPDGPMKGKFSYMANVQGVDTPLEVDLSEITFDWKNMLDNYPNASSGTEEQRKAVATLMQVIGYGVDMNYASKGSGAQTIKVSKILAENFGYDKGVQYLSRDCYTLSAWEEMLYTELAAGRPVLYDGSTVNNEGHAFVCDGYREQDGQAYFHINWGWGGTSDGYFLIGTLDPYEQGTGGAASGEGFDYNQDATINIKPAAGGEAVPSIIAQGDGLSITPGYFNIGREITVSYSGGGFYNHCYSTLSGVRFGVHVVGEGQDFYRWESTERPDLATNYGTASFNVLLTGIKENSTYVVTPAYRIGDTKYDIDMPYGKVRACVIKTSTTHGTVTPVGVGLEVSEIAFPEIVKPLLPNEISVTFTNTSETYYYGHMAPVFLEKEYGEYSVMSMLTNFTLNLEPGESKEWSLRRGFTSKDGFVDGEDYYFGVMDIDANKLVGKVVKFHYGKVSGIEDVAVDTEAPAEYFNLQGIRVAEPQAGQIYIVRRGAQVSKELVK